MQKKGEKYALTKPQHSLLLGLVNSRNKQSRKVFDKKDNCFTKKSIREIEEVTPYSKSSIGRLFKALRTRNLIKIVVNNNGDSVLMLSPAFMPLTTIHFEKLFKLAMYELGSFKKACEWSNACRADGVIYDFHTFTKADVIDFETGEVIPQRVVHRQMDELELLRWERFRQSYSSKDRTKWRKPRLA
ncbi:MarR family transcriptional regulator [Vibrio coralliilyticus]|uniref:MarR family transcriptional regulator n=1 Tax=Vibrio coralliilyticus TaxID=190893 RepID=UPI0039172BBA